MAQPAVLLKVSNIPDILTPYIVTQLHVPPPINYQSLILNDIHTHTNHL